MKSIPLHLLLADDDLDDCMFFQEVLEELPVMTRLTTVKDGVELMQMLLSKDQPLPHALYLDLNMPRQNGLECLKKIKQDDKLKHIPVIIFSTSFDKVVVNLLYEHGADFYICKPAEFLKLKQVICKSIELISTPPNGQVPQDQFVITCN